MSSPVVPNFFEFAFEGRQLVVEDQLLLVQQSPNQRRLAIVDRPAGEETQGRQGRRLKRSVHGRLAPSPALARGPPPPLRWGGTVGGGASSSHAAERRGRGTMP